MASDTDLLDQIRSAPDLGALDQLRVSVLGKSGSITGAAQVARVDGPRSSRGRSPEDPRPARKVTAAIADRKAALESGRARSQARHRDDRPVPARAGERRSGTVHPVSQVMDELAEIFADLGFAVADGPEIEDDWHNFTALNMPESHPARAMHDTFYLSGRGRARGEGAAHPHLAGADPRRCRRSRRTALRHRAGPRLPLRQRRNPHADVPPGRGPGHRPGHPHGPPQVDAGDLPQGLLRARRHRAAPAPVLFPVHRALGRGRCRLHARATASA